MVKLGIINLANLEYELTEHQSLYSSYKYSEEVVGTCRHHHFYVQFKNIGVCMFPHLDAFDTYVKHILSTQN